MRPVQELCQDVTGRSRAQIRHNALTRTGRYVNRCARAYLHSFQYVREIGIVREDREVAILIAHLWGYCGDGV